ncbi:MAG TPA: DUF6263 family protein [Abditibacterium sp.]
MKKLAILLALSATSPVMAQDQAAAPLANTAPVTAPDTAPFQWKLRLQAGQKLRTTSETLSLNSQQMPAMKGMEGGMNMENTSKVRFIIDQNVLSVDEKGARIEMIYREMTQTSRVMQGGKLVYDSANPPAEMKGFADMGKNIVGAQLSFLLSPQGKISEIEGVEAYANRVLEGTEKAVTPSPQTEAAQKNIREMMKGMMSSEFLEKTLSAAYGAMPTTPVALGASWNFESTMPMMGTTFTDSGKNTFRSRAKGIVSISQSGSFTSDAGAAFKVPLPANKLGEPAPVSQLDLSGTSTGEIEVDEASGLTLKSRISQRMNGEMVISGMAGKGSILTIPMQMESETTSTTEILGAQEPIAAN